MKVEMEMEVLGVDALARKAHHIPTIPPSVVIGLQLPVSSGQRKESDISRIFLFHCSES